MSFTSLSLGTWYLTGLQENTIMLTSEGTCDRIKSVKNRLLKIFEYFIAHYGWASLNTQQFERYKNIMVFKIPCDIPLTTIMWQLKRQKYTTKPQTQFPISTNIHFSFLSNLATIDTLITLLKYRTIKIRINSCLAVIA